MDRTSPNNPTRRLAGAALLLCGCIGTAQAAELEVRLTSDGEEYRLVQELQDGFEYFESGALTSAASGGIQTYDAIRCDGSWGAMKYQVSLPSGPGLSLRNAGDTLLLQIVEHAVISEDRNIQAMKMHCMELAPKPVVRAIAMIELDPGREKSAQQLLANGYQLEYHYKP
ncbi:hypothetical protein [uncultured Microbulbifer sp.]|uniref:hypothetical protein n=1 Tax=uncultured Microbulbifer sp. TaxID=348147 RepID=UPI0025E40F39|nr:hypothetical protein [uncultured Microbulbifer sp.]